MNNEFPQGSEWRKWDLHIHSKYSLEDSAKLNIKDIFTKAIDHKFSVISITDHSNVDGLNEIWDVWETEQYNDKPIKDQIEFFPGVELRTERGKHSVHTLAIFPKTIKDKRVDKQYLEANLLHPLELSSTKIEEAGNGSYQNGLFKRCVVFEDLSNKVKELGGLIIIHAGGKSNGIEKEIAHSKDEATEHELLNSLGDEKEKIMNSWVDLCELPNFESNSIKDRDFYLEKFNKPCVVFSDSHSSIVGDKFTWIKADPTFEGLRQIIYEPERVCIGLEPPVFERVRANKTKYISSLKINQTKGYKGAQGVWFKDVHVDFNKELVVIIGNKGSGKSALSDVIGVLGNTHNAGNKHENLSFLNGKILKFRKRGYAENFEAELVWEDESGKDVIIPLNHDVDIDQTEKIKYLPQNYFENLTNDLEGEGFDQTLKAVIFLHLPEEQRLECRTFTELENLRAKSIEANLSDLREEIHSFSEELIKLEAKKHPSYRKSLESSIIEKEKELKEHKKNKPSEKPDPSKSLDKKEDELKKKQYVELESLNTNSERISSEINLKRTELNKLVKEKEELVILKDSLTRLENNFSSYKSENKEAFEKFEIDINKVVSTTFDKKPLDEKIHSRENEIKHIAKLFLSRSEIDCDPTLAGNKTEINNAYKESLLVQQVEILEKIENIKKELSQPEKDFQIYKEQLKKWEEKKQEIEGTETQLNTLKFFTKEKDYLDNWLEQDIKNLRDKRLEKAIQIFEKKKEIIELYKVFKKSIDEEIGKDIEFTKKFNMEVDVNFKLDPNFSKNFLFFINKVKRGTFLGAGEKDVDELFVEKNLLSNEDITSILNDFIDMLENDRRETDEEKKGRQICDQIDRLQEFYDFLFDLEYLKPIYELKLDGKILDELSPGEKGTLLLVFYLMIDKEDIPLVIDQPEDNLDNKSVFQVLTHFIKNAKKRRQIIIVTHNPNLAVGADAEQVIYVELDKMNGKNIFKYEMGSIENRNINKRLVEILEGTMPAFDKRRLRYLKKDKL